MQTCKKTNQTNETNDSNANMQENPVAMAELSKYKRRAFRTFGNTYLSFEPMDKSKV